MASRRPFQKCAAPILPLAPWLQPVSVMPPPASSVITSTLPSELVSDWCESWITWPSAPCSAVAAFGIVAFTVAARLKMSVTSRIRVESSPALYRVLPSRENETSCASSATVSGIVRTRVAGVVRMSTTSIPLNEVLTVRYLPLGWIVVVCAPAESRLDR